MSRVARIALVVLAVVVAWPSGAWAQAVVAGVVKDASGAVLPGVTVEAASPVLIEKVRVATTDGSGQFRITALRPGEYTVTFSLAGFSSVKREGVLLTGTATTTVNADLKVGSVAETITVTGAAPLVDVQGVTSERTVNRELLNTVPTGRSAQNIAVLIPGIIVSAGPRANAADVGGLSIGDQQGAVIHGSAGSEMRQLLDGMTVAVGGAVGTPYLFNIGSTQEMNIDTSGLSAEENAGGVRITVIPREGGNVFHMQVYADGASPTLQSANVTPELTALGYPTPNPLKSLNKTWTFNPSGGGPIKKDKLWIYVAGNKTFDSEYKAIYPNKNAGDPNAWTYVPDTSATFPTYDTTIWDLNGRLTWQAAAKSKVVFYTDNQYRCICPAAAINQSPEAQPWRSWPLQRHLSVIYTSPLTNRLLIDAAVMEAGQTFPSKLAPTTDRSLISVNDTGTGILYRSFGEEGTSIASNGNVRASASYVTGTHALKAGFALQFATARSKQSSNPQSIDYRFNSGVPTTVVLYADPRDITTYSTDGGMYLQDRWTFKRVTLTGGIRYDYFSTHFPQTTLGPTLLTPTRNVTFPDTDGFKWQDITPRMGAAFDVFGDGKTAVKVSLNKYLFGLDPTAGASIYSFGLAPGNRVATSTTRSWNDTNKNFIPDCVLTNTAANGECGADANTSFGQSFATTTYDPNMLTGWSKRGYNWEFAASVQQQVTRRVSIDVGFFRRWFGNFITTDNLATAASDFTQFSIVAPLDPKLPGGGGYTVSGLYDVNPAKFGQTNNLLTLASNYGEQIQHWQGMDFNFNMRAWNGLTFQGGFSTGHTINDNCQIRAALPEMTYTSPLPSGNATTPLSPYCHTETAYITQARGLGSYTVPKIDVQLSAGIQNNPGYVIQANFPATNAFTQPSLGRPLAGNASTAIINLVEPGQLYGGRQNQVDLRIGKILRFAGRGKASVNADMYNAFNSSAVIIQNDSFSATNAALWQTPQLILGGRLMKLSVQFDF